ncbi:MAG: TIGR04282 family arsenosugar biosynthesis glycosyltransferase [Pseudomonadota bacterium]
MPSRPRLIIFARTPVLGTVKTRLAAVIGDQAALAAHIALTEGILARCVSPSDYDTELWLAGTQIPEDPVLARWLEEYELTPYSQPSGDLGRRMAFALEARPGPAVLIRSDLLEVDAGYINQALASLAEADVVIGPAEDGGYGLIGASRPVTELFSEVDWGTSRVYEQTQQRALKAALSVAVSGTLRDVDTPAEYHQWQRASPSAT